MTEQKMTNDPDEWRHFRRQRNKYNNDIKTAEKEILPQQTDITKQ